MVKLVAFSFFALFLLYNHEFVNRHKLNLVALFIFMYLSHINNRWLVPNVQESPAAMWPPFLRRTSRTRRNQQLTKCLIVRYLAFSTVNTYLVRPCMCVHKHVCVFDCLCAKMWSPLEVSVQWPLIAVWIRNTLPASNFCREVVDDCMSDWRCSAAPVIAAVWAGTRD